MVAVMTTIVVVVVMTTIVFPSLFRFVKVRVWHFQTAPAMRYVSRGTLAGRLTTPNHTLLPICAFRAPYGNKNKTKYEISTVVSISTFLNP